jgi:putative transposase
MDETYIKVAAQLKYLYRVVDRAGDTVNFLMTAKRDKAAARRFLESAINLHGLPEKITIDKSGANTAAIYSVNEDACLDIELRQCKCLNNIVEQDHRAVKRVTAPMLGFKSFSSTKCGSRSQHAHDQEGAVELPQEASHVCSRTVLQPGFLISKRHRHISTRLARYCDRTVLIWKRN